MDRHLLRINRPWACLAVLFCLWMIAGSALAQTTVTNTAFLSPPTGWRCATPNEAGNCTVAASVTNLVGAPQLLILKSAAASPLVVGGTASYTLQVSNTGTLATAGTITVRDSLPAGLAYSSATGTGWSCQASSNVVTCASTTVVAAGAQAAPITLTANVLTAALPQVTNTGSVRGGGDARCPTEGTPGQSCSSTVTTPVVQPVVTVAKTATPASGTTVQRGEPISYTLTATVSGAATVTATTLTDTLSAGLDFVTPLPSGCTANDRVMRCVVPAGTAVGSLAFPYQARVSATATGTVSNAVTGVACTAGASCSTSHPVVLPVVALSKIAVAPRSPAQVNDEISYTLRVLVSGAKTLAPVVLVDTLGAGLSPVSGSLVQGAFTCVAGNPLQCTLPPGTATGTYEVTYKARVTTDATGSVRNSVTGAPCASEASCTTTTPVAKPTVGVSKSTTATGSVEVGDELNYSLNVVVAGADTVDAVVLTDVLGTGLTLVATSVDGDDFDISNTTATGFVATLPVGTVPGTYSVTYQATVTDAAGTAVGNTVTPAGASCTGSCTTSTPVAKPGVALSKIAVAPRSPAQVNDEISYTLRVLVSGAKTLAPVVLVDTLGAGLSPVSGSLVQGAFTCVAGNPLQCTLPTGTAAGTYEVTYKARVTTDATGSVRNSVTGAPCASGACETTTPVAKPTVSVSKSTTATGSVEVGDELNYSLNVVVAGADTVDAVVLTDVLGTGLELVIMSPAGTGFSFSGASPTGFVATLPAKTIPGTYTVTYRAKVTAAAGTAVGNTVTPAGASCTGSCTTSTPVAKPGVALSKIAVAPRSPAQVNDEISYTLRVVVTDAKTIDAVTLTDTLGAGLELVAGSIVAGNFSCTAANPLVCTLPAGAAIGTHTVTYKARVTTDATGSVSNTVSGAPCTTGACSTDTPVAKPGVSLSKQVDKTAAVSPGDTLTYTIDVSVVEADLVEDLTLVDTLSGKQTFAAFTSTTGFTCPSLSNCVLPAGTVPGSYQLVYTTTVDADATGSVGNSVVATGGDPLCTSCTTTTPVVASSATVNKSVDKTGEVKPGQTLTYTIDVVVAGSALAENLILVDTLSGKQTFVAFTSTAGFTCPSLSNCVLPAGTLPGSYEVVYTTTVDADATGSVGNSVVATGGDPVCTTCTTTTPVIKSVARVSKSVAQTQAVRPGDVLDFTLVLSLEQAANAGDISLIDTLGEGLEFVGVTNAGAFSCSRELTCILAAGHMPGQYTVTYQARVAASAGAEVRNTVVAIEQDPNNATPSLPGDPGQPLCETCQTITPVAREVNLRISKVAAVREARIGDLVRYTLEVENIGDGDLVDGVVIDNAPAGFSLVAGSLVVIDGDNAAQVGNGAPLRFSGIDIAAGEQAQLVYLMRVGAGVRNGVQVNRAQVRDADGSPLSNEATAQVIIGGDPLLEDSLVLGTVFDDRNGDGRQASAGLSEVFVQGGFDPQAYIANSTTIERDGVRQPLADASSPLLHGVAVGNLVGRTSTADNGASGTVVIRQRLREAAFTGDFALRSRQGLGVTLTADGQASITRQGDAADGLSAAELQVERRISQVADGVEVAYVIRNTGIDERGIPGVRIASVEGLLMETDQFGRYHLVGISAGEQARGRNHVLKVDPSTLPAGATFTTDNPLLRRITPGMPARFDFGVRLPVEQIGGRSEQVELEMGQVLFAPGSDTLQVQYLPVIAEVAARVRQYDGGEVVIAADGEGHALAMARAEAVHQALRAALDTGLMAKVQVQVRALASDAGSTLVGLQGEDLLLGTVLFDTDKAVIKPEFQTLLDAVAARLQQRRGGTVAIVGHTDVRGSHTYNAALGLRRAKAVHEALMQRLSQEVRDHVRVDASGDTTAPIDAGRE